MITERHMAAGKWDITLDENTPQRILDLIDVRKPGVGFGHIVITPTAVDPALISDADMLSLSCFTGVYRAQKDRLSMSGASANVWVADEDGKGAVYNSGVSTATGTLAEWVTALRPASIGLGIFVSVAGNFTKTYGRTNLAAPLLEVRRFFNVNWRITNALKFDIAPMASLYRVTPKAVVLRKEGEGGRDIGISGIVGSTTVERDLDDWVRRVNYFTGTSGSPTVSTADGGVADIDVPYRAPDGSAIRIDKFIEDFGATPTSAGPGLAAAEYLKYKDPRQKFTLDGTQYDIKADVTVGDNISVYDPISGIQNLDYPVSYRGQTIYPERVRCEGMTWPVRQGFGVYLRRWVRSGGGWSPDWINLTNYFVPESGKTSIDIGAAPRI